VHLGSEALKPGIPEPLIRLWQRTLYLVDLTAVFYSVHPVGMAASSRTPKFLKLLKTLETLTAAA
jgi:hypothetical protein